LLLLDIGLPDINGYQVLKRIKSLKPKLPVLILTGRPEYQFIVVMIKEGASGYLNKNETSEHLIEAIRTLATGGFYISPSLRDRLLYELRKDGKNIYQERLTDIESEIMYLLIEGKTIKDIAESLLLSINAVSAFKSIILKKLNMESDSELMRQCVLEYLPHDFSYA
jgi:DNA-binding NarL/FixJ family response regulator